MTNNEAHAQAFENGRKVGDAEGYARGKAEAVAEAGDLISRKAARETCQRIFSDPVLIHAVDTTLNNTPAVAAKPVKHGRWVYDVANLVMCTNCLGSVNRRMSVKYKYCPNCGTRMDGGELS